MTPIRVLVADDAVVVRRLLARVIGDDPALEVVGIAQNGAIAVAKTAQLQPDVVVLDVEMPEMDGLEALTAIRRTDRRVAVIMFSTLTERGGTATLEALSRGASDYVTKPANTAGLDAAIEHVRNQLLPRIKALHAAGGGGAARASRRIVGLPTAPPASAVASDVASVVTAPPASPSPAATHAAQPQPQPQPRTDARRAGPIDLVVIGSSTGGPAALSAVLGALPADLRVPVVVAQHMPPVFTRLLAERLDATAAVSVREAVDGDVLRPGVALIAPGDFHLRFRRGSTSTTVRLDQQPPVNFCRPSVDVMFDAAADVFGGRVLVVVLTGMGHDGRDGAARLRLRGATVLVQDEATSVVWGMPGAVVGAGLADAVLPVGELGAHIARLVGARASLVATP